MNNIIDLSIFKKEDFIIKSISGEEYRINGNFSTEFYIDLYEVQEKMIKIYEEIKNLSKELQKEKSNNVGSALANKIKQIDNDSIKILKELTLKLLQLDKSKTVTMETIDREFDNLDVLKYLYDSLIKYTNERTNDPN